MEIKAGGGGGQRLARNAKAGGSWTALASFSESDLARAGKVTRPGNGHMELTVASRGVNMVLYVQAQLSGH